MRESSICLHFLQRNRRQAVDIWEAVERAGHIVRVHGADDRCLGRNFGKGHGEGVREPYVGIHGLEWGDMALVHYAVVDVVGVAGVFDVVYAADVVDMVGVSGFDFDVGVGQVVSQAGVEVKGQVQVQQPVVGLEGEVALMLEPASVLGLGLVLVLVLWPQLEL